MAGGDISGGTMTGGIITGPIIIGGVIKGGIITGGTGKTIGGVGIAAGMGMLNCPFLTC